MSAFVRRWIVTVGVAEAAGFAIATGVAVATISSGLTGAWSLAAVVAGGALEGAALGTGQYLAMRSGRPRPLPWIAGTAAAAAFAWLLGMLPSTLGVDLGSPATIVALTLGGLVLLASIPVTQWLVLHRTGTFAWVPVNMGAWAVAILWTFAPSPIIDERSPLALVVVLYVLAGLLMAVTIASFTAPLARRLFAAESARA
ncbi:hypothetical protein PYV02_00340 [Leifsonia sp. H3M29-4]|uniref:hypothetical protein n=1 Tax=Salinibacterium metalliresistens TaxID=3031321 RepID=UPI0023DABEF4|nr:hypothetical protein [Salinibacterium metalliresistens]MDF1477525.1 hypothetical protein [Salinibacterium metalliresistens]